MTKKQRVIATRFWKDFSAQNTFHSFRVTHFTYGARAMPVRFLRLNWLTPQHHRHLIANVTTVLVDHRVHYRYLHTDACESDIAGEQRAGIGLPAAICQPCCARDW